MSTALSLEGLSGLTEAHASLVLAEDGPNELALQKPRTLWAIAFSVVREPMFLMLVAAGSLYLVMGEVPDALLLLGFVFVIMGITIVQERRTENALAALRDLSAPHATVIRDGVRKRIAGRHVVVGDLVVLCEGDRVTADGLLRRAVNLMADESLLSGESAPVRKVTTDEQRPLDAPGGDDRPSVFSGTLVTAGQGIIEVVATGPESALGQIGTALEQPDEQPTMLQAETTRLVRLLAIVGLVACVIVVVVFALTRGGGLEQWKQGALAGITMAMAVLPEEFPVILTVFLALGAWRLSRHHVLTRRMPAVETLGAATVLCVDKTGTLTQNQMTLQSLSLGTAAPTSLGTLTTLPEPLHEVLEQAILASTRSPFDPMEKALLEVGTRLLGGTEHLHPGFTLEREWPLSPALLAVSYAWKTPEGLAVASKGAPEAIIELCHLPPERRAEVTAAVTRLAQSGLRVLGVAKGRATAPLPELHHDLTLEFVGLLGFADPLRPSVPAAVAQCQRAGVRVVMITGDAEATAISIAAQAGIANAEHAVLGPELLTMTDEALAARVRTAAVFARVVPRQKLRIVQALKANGETVAMTGDGVNDAPALKAAHIGIAMGQRGTDVAREAASLVLLDDEFSTIVGAISLGRRIFDNIKKAVTFTVAVHVPIAGLSMIPVFFAGWPLLLLPIHIVFLELIIDPACSLVFEAELAEDDVMLRPPRDRHEKLFSAGTLGFAALEGLSVLAACLAVFLSERTLRSAEAGRTASFVTLVIGVVTIILVDRSWARSALAMLRVKNAALRWVLLGVAVFLTVALAVPLARTWFRFDALPAIDVAVALAAGALCLSWVEVARRFRRRQPAATRAALAPTFLSRRSH
jgi:Ca2+-transporting ATPase